MLLSVSSIDQLIDRPNGAQSHNILIITGLHLIYSKIYGHS